MPDSELVVPAPMLLPDDELGSVALDPDVPDVPELSAGALELLPAAPDVPELGSVAPGVVGAVSVAPGMLGLGSVALGVAGAVSMLPVVPAPDVPEVVESVPGVVVDEPDILLEDESGAVLAASGAPLSPASRWQPINAALNRLTVRRTLEVLDSDFIVDPFTDY